MLEEAKIQTLYDNTTNEAIAPRTVISAVSGIGSEGQLIGFTGENTLGIITPDETPKEGSNKFITSGVIYDEINKLTTKTEVTNMVHNFRVGCRNYLIGTKDIKTYTVNTPLSTTGFQTFDPYSTLNKKELISLGFKVNDSITFSFDWSIAQIKSDTPFTYGNFRAEWVGWVNNKDNQYIATIENPIDTFSEDHTSGRAEFTTVLTKETLHAHTLRLRFDNDVFIFNMLNCKMEIGNKASDWTPAPEDKQDTLTFDDSPANESINPVKSSGIYNAIEKCKIKVLTLTLTVPDWQSEPPKQTITAEGILAKETAQLIIPTPAMSSLTNYYDSGVKLTAQATNKLTFTANIIPESNLIVYVAIIPVEEA